MGICLNPCTENEPEEEFKYDSVRSNQRKNMQAIRSPKAPEFKSEMQSSATIETQVQNEKVEEPV